MSVTNDIGLKAVGSGSDYVFIDEDIQLSESLYMTIYIALFGGNVKASTTGDEISTEKREDWWGNEVFNLEEPEKQFNSETQRTLNNTPLSSSGRLTIKSAVENDLEFLKVFVDFEVEVLILSNSGVRINVSVISAETSRDLYSLLWENGIVENIINETI